MGAPESGIEAAAAPTADGLLTALRTIKPAERARHASVLDYWLSIRGDKEFPPLHDLDPLEISDAGPNSILLELIGGGQDAEIRHLGEALQSEAGVQRIIDTPNPSILGCIAKKLAIVAISRDFLAFEDSFTAADGAMTRCWITLLPLSSCGSWVDYVYAFASVETSGAKAAKAPEPDPVAETPEPEQAVAEESEAPVDTPIEPEVAPDETPAPLEPVEDVEVTGAVEARHEPNGEEPSEDGAGRSSPGFSKLIEGIASLTGFYGQGIKADDVVSFDLPEDEPSGGPSVVETEATEPETADPVAEEPVAGEPPLELEEPAPEPEPAAAPPPLGETPVEAAAEFDPAPQPAPAMEGNLQSKLVEVQAKADEARQAQLRATQALHQGLSAAYDFAIDAESSPEEYLRLVEAQGLKIQLRAPMAPVAKLAFDGVCDAATIRQFEAVLAWALKVELPRGALLERIEQAGGVPELLEEFARAA